MVRRLLRRRFESARVFRACHRAVELHQSGLFERAYRLSMWAADRALETLPRGDKNRAKALINAAALSSQSVRYGQAEAYFELALPEVLETFDQRDPAYAKLLNSVAVHAESMGDREAAVRLYKAACEHAERATSLDAAMLVTLEQNVASVGLATRHPWTLVHIERHPEFFERRAAIIRGPRAGHKGGRRQMDRERDEYLELSTASSQRANEILRTHRETGDPFGLFLRGFGYESTRTLISPHDARALSEINTLIQPPWVETELVPALAERLPMIAISNPADLVSSGAWESTPKLAVPGEEWQSIVGSLIRSAHMIVLYSGHKTPGIEQELDAIRRAGRADSTIVILAEDDALRSEVLESARSIAESLGQVVESESVETKAPLDPEDPILREFSRVTTESAIEEPVAACPQFVAHLASVPTAKKAMAELMRATALLDGGRAEEAIPRFERSLASASHLASWGLRVEALHLLGCAQARSGNGEGARRVLREALELARDQGDPMLGRVLFMLGFVDLNDAQFRRALPRFQEAMQHATRDVDLAECYLHAAHCYRQLGRTDEASHALSEYSRLTETPRTGC